jgi:hypothetical protein
MPSACSLTLCFSTLRRQLRLVLRRLAAEAVGSWQTEAVRDWQKALLEAFRYRRRPAEMLSSRRTAGRFAGAERGRDG